jgi:hypothetical protein
MLIFVYFYGAVGKMTETTPYLGNFKGAEQTLLPIASWQRSPSLMGTTRVRSADAIEARFDRATSIENFVFQNFNQPLIASRSDTDTDSTTLSENNFVVGISTAQTFFRLDETTNKDLGTGSVISEVTGEGIGDGFADGLASVGGTFFVETGESFSFEFSGYLTLGTTVQNADRQTAIAFGRLAFGVYDVTDQPIRLDFLEVSGGLDTPGTQDFLNVQTIGSNISLNPQSTTIARQTGSLDESAFVAVSGLYRTQPFERDTLLVLGDLEITTLPAEIAQSE